MIRRFWDEFGFLIIVFLIMVCMGTVLGLLIDHQEKHPLTYKEFDGHEYVIYHVGLREGFTHSPNCHCLTNQFTRIDVRSKH